MIEHLLRTSAIPNLMDKLSGLDQADGDERLKKITKRIVGDLFNVIEEFDVTPAEFWTAVSYLTRVGQSNEGGLVAAGLGFEHFLDLRFDEKERQAGLDGGTPRTIEGPLWIADAPMETGEARLDQDPEIGEALFMRGQVRDIDGKPVPHAIVDVWHANTRGGYSFFDPSQSAFNLRRQIRTDEQGRYKFRTILPAGYGCPPDGPTQQWLTAIGRHGNRPAHVHFFVSAPGYRKLTTQINIAGDAYLHDDFAFATRDELIPGVARSEDPDAMRDRGLNSPFVEIEFDFTIHPETDRVPDTVIVRDHAKAA